MQEEQKKNKEPKALGATRGVTEILHQAQKGQTPDQFRRTVNQLTMLILNLMAKFKKLPPGVLRAKMIHRKIDIETEKALASSPNIVPSCKKGCAACCGLAITITDDEAALLHQRIKKDMLIIDTKKLRMQAEVLHNVDDRRAWNALPFEDRRCVFLDRNNNECMVYEDRPISCRKYLVNSKPQFCENIKGTSSVVNIYMSEIVASAAFNLDQPNRSLQSRLVERMDKANESN